MPIELSNKIIDGLFSVRGSTENIFVITVDTGGTIRFRTSFDHPSDEIYIMEATKMQILCDDRADILANEKEEDDDD